MMTFWFWCLLLVAGQAAALTLIDAGPRLHYQHWRPLSEVVSAHGWAALVIVAQAVTVGVAAARRAGAIGRWLGENVKVWQGLGIAAGFVMTTATLSPSIPRYIEELALATLVQAIQLGNTWRIGAGLPEPVLRWVRGQVDRAGQPGRAREIALTAAVLSFLLAAGLAHFIYEEHPHLQDEAAYVLHARYLEAGALRTPAPPVPEAFALYLMENDGKWQYPVTLPGWPALLALGMAAGAGWLVNPVAAGLGVYAMFLLARELYGNRLAAGAALLFAVSPWQLFLAMGYMTHTVTVLLAMAGGVAAVRASRSGRLWPFWVAGAAAGAAVTIRPLDGALVALCLGVLAIWSGSWRNRLARGAVLSAGFALPVAALLSYNVQLTGSATPMPINAYIDKHFGKGRNDLGFGANRGMGWALDPNPGHSPVDAAINSNLNATSINFDLFGWGCGSLGAVFLLLLARRTLAADWALGAVIAAVVGTFALYYFSGGPDFGARYWFLILPPLILLALRGLGALSERLPGSRYALAAAVMALSVSAVLTVVPWRAADKYYGYLQMRPDAERLAGIGPALVLVRGREFPDYASAVVYGAIDFHAAEPVFARDLDARVRARLLAAFPSRPVWILEGRSQTGGAARMLGPFRAAEVAGR